LYLCVYLYPKPIFLDSKIITNMFQSVKLVSFGLLISSKQNKASVWFSKSKGFKNLFSLLIFLAWGLASQVAMGQPLNIVSTNPARNALNQNNNATIQAVVTGGTSNNISAATLNFNFAKVYGNQTGFYTAGGWTGGNTNTISYTPPSYQYKKGEVITVEFTTSMASTGAVNFTTTQQYQFTAKAVGGSGVFITTNNMATLGTGLRKVCAFDADGDGDMDLATSNQGSTNVSVFKNNGNGTYTPAVTYGVTGAIVDVIAFDADGDGDMDLASANASTDRISILKNNGNGTFSGLIMYGAGGNPDNPNGLCAFDADGDGDMDIATANGTGGNISVFKNNGNGAFPTNTNYTAGTNPYAVRAFDADGDGDMDLVCANSGSASVSFFRNIGNGTFAGQVSCSTGVGTTPYDLYTFDADGDGDMDIVTGNLAGNTIRILTNNGTGTFTLTQFCSIGTGIGNANNVYAFDADGDGDMDIVCSSGTAISVLKNDGSGIYGTSMVFPVTNPLGISAFDADGDGDMDLAIANTPSNTVSIWFNQPKYDITAISPARNALNQNNNVALTATTSANVNGTTLNFNNAKVYGSQTGFFTAGAWAGGGTSSISYTPTTYPFKKGEIITTEFITTLRGTGGEVFISTHQYQFTAAASGTGNFVSVGTYFTANNINTARAATGDMDGDGLIDIVTSNETNSTVSVFRNTGSGNFTLMSSPAVGATPRGIIVADFNGDGKLDIATANNGTTNVLTQELGLLPSIITILGLVVLIPSIRLIWTETGIWIWFSITPRMLRLWPTTVQECLRGQLIYHLSEELLTIEVCT
jgi:FG-GAP-like repeat